MMMGWSSSEQLCILQSDGAVLIFTIFGELTNQFSMGKQVKAQGIFEARMWGNGIVVMSNHLNFFVVQDLEDPQPIPMNCPPLTASPPSWTIIEPRFSPTRQIQVLVATETGTILVVDVNNPPVDPFLVQGPFLKMSLSPLGNMLACYTASGSVFITPPDFQGVCHTFATESQVVPKELAWCGGDSVVCLWEMGADGKHLLLMVGPQNSYLNYNYYEPLFLVPEMDGLRIISQSECEWWQLVPCVTVDTLQLGSTQPSAILYDAARFFQEESPQADEFIRRIQGDLAVAVKKCIEAAGYEISHVTQQKLLNAASFGKSFVEFYSPDYFVNMCKVIRVLNALRDESVGIPITYDQFKQLTPRLVIDHLVNRHQHVLAFSICKYLKIKPDQVLVHWACSKVKRLDLGDDDILYTVVSKLQPIPGISYAEIASAAYKYGRSRLATSVSSFISSRFYGRLTSVSCWIMSLVQLTKSHC